MEDDKTYSNEEHNFESSSCKYETEDFSEIHETVTKNHIKFLRTLSFDREITLWVETQLNNLTQRFHKIDNVTLSALIIKAHIALDREYSIDDILQETDCSTSKKRVLSLIQGTDLKRSAANEGDLIVPILITSPAVYIPEIVESFCNNYNIQHEIKCNLLMKIIYFGDILYRSIVILSNFSPRCCACAFVYYYMKKFFHLTGLGKINVTKYFFKKHKFGEKKQTKMSNTDDFAKTLEIISSQVELFLEENKSDPSLIAKLISHSDDEQNTFEKDDM